MTHEEKLFRMDIATRIVGFGFSRNDLDIIISLYELIQEESGETKLKDILATKGKVEDFYNNKKENQ